MLSPPPLSGDDISALNCPKKTSFKVLYFQIILNMKQMCCIVQDTYNKINRLSFYTSAADFTSVEVFTVSYPTARESYRQIIEANK